MDSNKRLLITVLLCVGIILGFEYVRTLVRGPAPAAAPAPAPQLAIPAPTPPPAEKEPGTTVAPGAPLAPSPTEAAPAEELTTLRTDGLVARFSSVGPGLVSAELQGEKSRRQGGRAAPHVDLAEGLRADDPRLFETRLQGALAAPAPPRSCTQVEATARSITYACNAAELSVTKKFEIEGERVLVASIELTNLGTAPKDGALELIVPARVDPEKQAKGGGCGGFLGPPPSPTQAICRHGDEVTRRLFDKDEPRVTPAGSVSFAGIEERYFAAVAVPLDGGGERSCTLETPDASLVIASIVTQIAPIAPGDTATLRYALVLGEKEIDKLAATSARLAEAHKVADPGLRDAVDLGFWAAIASVLLSLMKIFYALIPNWGVAIVLLTVTVKVLTLPLAWKSMKSMEQMRALAPEIEQLKKKHEGDREKLNLEMMALYQRHKVNPLGGCLPMLIQMPIWLALYTTLQGSVELYNEPFIGGWINDLTSKDPYYVLPVVMGITMFATQKMQPMQMEAMQQKMMLYFMPIFFTMIMLQLPSGLTLYIFTNNVLSIGQQMLLRRSMGMPAIGAPRAAAMTVEAKSAAKKKKES